MKTTKKALLILILFLFPSIALAQDSDTPDAAETGTETTEEPQRSAADRARDLQARSAVAFDAGEFNRAVDLLERAFALHPEIGYIYNRIRALEGAHRYEEGLALLETFREALIDDSGSDDINSMEEDLITGLSRLRGDDDPLEPTDPVAPPPTVDSGPDILAISLLGGGGLALGSGLLLASGLLISDTIDRLESPQQDAQDLYYGDAAPFDRDADLRTLRTHQILSAVLIAGGAATAGAGAFFLLRGNPDQSAPGVTLELTPAAGPTFTGATLRARF